jgi:hypothetical protein
MNKMRAATLVATVGVLGLLGGGVANASPGGYDPYAGLPLEVRNWLQPTVAAVMHFFGIG